MSDVKRTVEIIVKIAEGTDKLFTDLNKQLKTVDKSVTAIKDSAVSASTALQGIATGVQSLSSFDGTSISAFFDKLQKVASSDLSGVEKVVGILKEVSGLSFEGMKSLDAKKIQGFVAALAGIDPNSTKAFNALVKSFSTLNGVSSGGIDTFNPKKITDLIASFGKITDTTVANVQALSTALTALSAIKPSVDLSSVNTNALSSFLKVVNESVQTGTASKITSLHTALAGFSSLQLHSSLDNFQGKGLENLLAVLRGVDPKEVTTLGKVTKALSAFGDTKIAVNVSEASSTNLTKLLEVFRGVTDDDLAKVKAVTAILKNLSGFSGGSGLASLDATPLVNFFTALKSIHKPDYDKAEPVSEAIKKLKSAGALPSYDALDATKLVTFFTELTKIHKPQTDKATQVTEALQKLAAIGTLPSFEGLNGTNLISFFTALQGISKDQYGKAGLIAEALSKFKAVGAFPDFGKLDATKLTAFFSSLKDVATADVTKTKKMGEVIATLSKINFSALSGMNLDATQLVAFFAAIKSLDPNSATLLASLGEALTKFAGIKLPPSFEGMNAQPLVTFIQALQQITDADIANISKISPTLAELGRVKFGSMQSFAGGEALLSFLKSLSSVSDKQLTTLSTLGTAFASLATVKDFSKLFKGMDSTALQSFITALGAMKGNEAENAKQLVSALQAFAGLENVSSALKSLDATKIQKFLEVFQKASAEDISKVANLATALVSLGSIPSIQAISQLPTKKLAELFAAAKDVDRQSIDNVAAMGKALAVFNDVKIPSFKNLNASSIAGFFKALAEIPPDTSTKANGIISTLELLGKIKSPAFIAGLDAQKLIDFFVRLKEVKGVDVGNLTQITTALSGLGSVTFPSKTSIENFTALITALPGLSRIRIPASLNAELMPFLQALSSISKFPNVNTIVKSLTDLAGAKLPSFKDLIGQLEKLSKAFNEIGLSTTLVNSLNTIAADGGKAAEALKKTGKEAESSGHALHDFWTRVQRYLYYRIIADSVIGLKEAFVNAREAIINFDQSLKDLQAITQATDEQIASMGVTIQRIAGSTRYSTSEIAQGMLILGQAGLTAEETMQAIGPVAALATGTLSDMAVTVDVVATAITAFGMSANESARIADVFANAVNGSKLTIEKLQTALNYIAPVSASAGISLEDTAAAMMTLSNNGQRASTIGTGLRRIFSELVDPSDKLREAADKAGISLRSLDPSSNKLEDVLRNLSVVIHDTATAFTVFGKYGASSALALVNDVEGGFMRMEEIVGRSGITAEMAAKQMEGLGASMKNMRTHWEMLAQALGDAGGESVLRMFIDSMRTLADLLTYFVRGVLQPVSAAFGVLKSMIDGVFAFIPDNIRNFLLFGAAISAIINPVGLVILAFERLAAAHAVIKATSATSFVRWIASLETLAGVSTTAAAATTAVSTAAAATAPATAAATAGVTGFRYALTLLFTIIRNNPVGLAIAAFVALGVAVAALWETSDKLLQKYEEESQKLKELTKSVEGYSEELEKLRRRREGVNDLNTLKLIDEDSEKLFRRMIEAFPEFSGEILLARGNLEKLQEVLDKVGDTAKLKLAEEATGALKGLGKEVFETQRKIEGAQLAIKNYKGIEGVYGKDYILTKMFEDGYNKASKSLPKLEEKLKTDIARMAKHVKEQMDANLKIDWENILGVTGIIKGGRFDQLRDEILKKVQEINKASTEIGNVDPLYGMVNKWKVELANGSDYFTKFLNELKSGAGAFSSEFSEILYKIDPASGEKVLAVDANILQQILETRQDFVAKMEAIEADESLSAEQKYEKRRKLAEDARNEEVRIMESSASAESAARVKLYYDSTAWYEKERNARLKGVTDAHAREIALQKLHNDAMSRLKQDQVGLIDPKKEAEAAQAMITVEENTLKQQENLYKRAVLAGQKTTEEADAEIAASREKLYADHAERITEIYLKIRQLGNVNNEEMQKLFKEVTEAANKADDARTKNTEAQSRLRIAKAEQEWVQVKEKIQSATQENLVAIQKAETNGVLSHDAAQKAKLDSTLAGLRSEYNAAVEARDKIDAVNDKGTWDKWEKAVKDAHQRLLAALSQGIEKYNKEVEQSQERLTTKTREREAELLQNAGNVSKAKRELEHDTVQAAKNAADQIAEADKDLSDSRKEIAYDAAKSRTAIEYDLAKELKKIQKDIDKSRRESAAKILEIGYSTADKLRAIDQRNMSDSQKEVSNTQAAYQKIAEAKMQIAKGDAESIKKGEELLKQAQDLGAALKADGAAKELVSETGKLLIEAEKAAQVAREKEFKEKESDASDERDYKLKLLDEETAHKFKLADEEHKDKLEKIELEKQKRIDAIGFTYSKAMQDEETRHTAAMKNIDAEMAKIQQALAVAQQMSSSLRNTDSTNAGKPYDGNTDTAQQGEKLLQVTERVQKQLNDIKEKGYTEIEENGRKIFTNLTDAQRAGLQAIEQGVSEVSAVVATSAEQGRGEIERVTDATKGLQQVSMQFADGSYGKISILPTKEAEEIINNVERVQNTLEEFSTEPIVLPVVVSADEATAALQPVIENIEQNVDAIILDTQVDTTDIQNQISHAVQGTGQPVTLPVEANFVDVEKTIEETQETLEKEDVVLEVTAEKDEAFTEVERSIENLVQIGSIAIETNISGDPQTYRAAGEMYESIAKFLAAGGDSKDLSINIAAEEPEKYRAISSAFESIADSLAAINAIGEISIDIPEPRVLALLYNAVLALSDALDALPDVKIINVAADVSGISLVRDLKNAIDQLHDKTVVITTIHRSVSEAASGGPIDKYASGGGVFPRLSSRYINKGSGTKDDVPALLMRGEYVHKVAAVQKYGRAFMESVNHGIFPVELARKAARFASGGMVVQKAINEHLGGSVQQFARGGLVLADVVNSLRRRLFELTGADSSGVYIDNLNFTQKMDKVSDNIASPLGMSFVNKIAGSIGDFASGGSVMKVLRGTGAKISSAKSGISKEYAEAIAKAKLEHNNELVAILEKEKETLLTLTEELNKELAELQKNYEESTAEATENDKERDEEYAKNVSDEETSYAEESAEKDKDYQETKTEYDTETLEADEQHNLALQDLKNSYSENLFSKYSEIEGVIESLKGAALEVNKLWNGLGTYYPQANTSQPVGGYSETLKKFMEYWKEYAVFNINPQLASIQYRTNRDGVASGYTAFKYLLGSIYDREIRPSSFEYKILPGKDKEVDALVQNLKSEFDSKYAVYMGQLRAISTKYGIDQPTNLLTGKSITIGKAPLQELASKYAALGLPGIPGINNNIAKLSQILASKEYSTQYDDEVGNYTKDKTSRDNTWGEYRADFDKETSESSSSHAERLASLHETYAKSVVESKKAKDERDLAYKESVEAAKERYDEQVVSTKETTTADTTSAEEKLTSALDELKEKFAQKDIDAKSSDTDSKSITENDAELISTVRAVTLDELLKKLKKPKFQFNTGGFVPFLPGALPNRDSIVSALTPGEFVIRAPVVQKFGSQFFDALNNFQVPKFALGGIVGSIENSLQGGSDVTHSLALTINGNTHEPLLGTPYGIENLLNDLSLAKLRS